MRVREKQITLWVTFDEYHKLKSYADKSGVSLSEYLRQMGSLYQPTDKPDKEFYDSIKVLRGYSNSLNQLARKANALNFIDEPEYRRNVNIANEIILDLKKKYLLPKKLDEFLSNNGK